MQQRIDAIIRNMHIEAGTRALEDRLDIVSAKKEKLQEMALTLSDITAKLENLQELYQNPMQIILHPAAVYMWRRFIRSERRKFSELFTAFYTSSNDYIQFLQEELEKPEKGGLIELLLLGIEEGEAAKVMAALQPLNEKLEAAYRRMITDCTNSIEHLRRQWQIYNPGKPIPAEAVSLQHG